MNNKIFTPVLAIVLLICFFLPYFSNGLESLSPFNIVFGKSGSAGVGTAERYLWLLIPLVSLLLLFGGSGFTTSSFIFWLPLISLVYIVVRFYIGVSAESSGGVEIGDVFKILGYGFWISLVAAILLPFSKSR